MNPITNAKNVVRMNEKELRLGVAGSSTSWHSQYKHSAWIFVGGLPYDLTEGDVLCVFSQYGEIVNINLVRDKDTGKSKGFCFICYEDQRSTILAVDNLNTIKILGRIIRVDHCDGYKQPKDHNDTDDVTRRLRDEGCAPKVESSSSAEEEEEEELKLLPVKIKVKKEKKKKKKEKKTKKEKKQKKNRESSLSLESSDNEPSNGKLKAKPLKHLKTKPEFNVPVKRERHDSGYDKYAHHEHKRSLESGASPPSRKSKTARTQRSDPSGSASQSASDSSDDGRHQRQQRHRARNSNVDIKRKHDRDVNARGQRDRDVNARGQRDDRDVNARGHRDDRDVNARGQRDYRDVNARGHRDDRDVNARGQRDDRNINARGQRERRQRSYSGDRRHRPARSRSRSMSRERVKDKSHKRLTHDDDDVRNDVKASREYDRRRRSVSADRGRRERR